MLNFTELENDVCSGRLRPQLQGLPLRVTAVDGTGATGRYFRCGGDDLFLRRGIIPSMFTRNTEMIRQDCLCYLMPRIDLPASLQNV